MTSAEMFFNSQAYFNKWLKELTEQERIYVISMLEQFHKEESENVESQPEAEQPLSDRQTVVEWFTVINICTDERLTSSEKVDELKSFYTLIKK